MYNNVTHSNCAYRYKWLFRNTKRGMEAIVLYSGCVSAVKQLVIMGSNFYEFEFVVFFDEFLFLKYHWKFNA